MADAAHSAKPPLCQISDFGWGMKAFSPQVNPPLVDKTSRLLQLSEASQSLSRVIILSMAQGLWAGVGGQH